MNIKKKEESAGFGAPECTWCASFSFKGDIKHSSIRKTIEKSASNSVDSFVNYNVACIYSGMGEIDKAINHLEISLKLGSKPLGWITNDSDLDPLQGLPQFQELMEKYK